MKPGPPPIPFPLKHLRGNPGHQRLHAEPEPRRESKCPEPPPGSCDHGFCAYMES
jgi:hypothetical protein